uniref:Methyl Transferase n=1 Tax=Magnaporthe oryzae polymycovirus 2 TaxID=2838331 RepID=A0A8E6Z6E8_9VIRU|nr:Methyl Transferase [Magnaporthe oryzae polymycovirus 2]
MNSDAGIHLRSMEAEYVSTFYQFLSRSVRLAGTRVLVLGSGSSKALTRLLSRGVSSAVFVDTSEDALADLDRSVQAVGLHARVEVEYVCEDAWTFLEGCDDNSFDVVIATKCVGLVLSGPGQRDEARLLDLVTDVLDVDGSFFTDHQVAFSDPALSLQRVADVAGEHYDLATICGRYADDVCYSWTGMANDNLKCVASYITHRSASMVQCWEMFHFRVPTAPVPTRPVRVTPSRGAMPAGFVAKQSDVFDRVADAMVPVNNKGVKRIPGHDDIGAYDIAATRLKLDGVPGVLQLSGPVGVFVSPTVMYALTLGRNVSPPLTLSAETVWDQHGVATAFVTGTIRIGTAAADPLDYAALRPLLPTLSQLSGVGIAVNHPDLVRSVTGSVLTLTGANGVSRSFPVDGVQVTVAGRDGVFIKPQGANTVDATSADIKRLIVRASDALGLPDPVVTLAPDSGVWEYRSSAALNLWVPARPRRDKTKSDTLGAVIHTLAAAHASASIGLETTVEGVLRQVAR